MAACHVRAVARFVSTIHLGTRPGTQARERLTGVELGVWAMLVGGFLWKKPRVARPPKAELPLSYPVRRRLRFFCYRCGTLDSQVPAGCLWTHCVQRWLWMAHLQSSVPG